LENILVLYHAGCPDGFGAAWACWNKFGDKAKYVPVKHGAPPPNVEGRNVIIVDFSYPETILLEMDRVADSLVLIDHHESAMKDLSHLSFCHFDMNFSGAYLAWKYFFEEESIPLMLRYISDRDLWKWEMPHSRAILIALDSIPKTFKKWSRFSDLCDQIGSSSWNSIMFEGYALLSYKDTLIKRIFSSSFNLEIGGHIVPVVNTPIFQSEVASQLVSNDSFSAAYYFDGDQYRFSLRSSDDGIDVSSVAKIYGGGGHRNASGFRIKNLNDL
jgi:oligoribonuclease NrnB/cAMP/cGMP phosphodiesterase (DHH superfamily)